MNAGIYYKEIAILRQSVVVIRELVSNLGDAQAEMDNHGDIAAYESDSTLLSLAADIIEKTLPRKPSHTFTTDGKP